MPTRFRLPFGDTTRGQQVPTLPNTAFRKKQQIAVKAIPKRTGKTRNPSLRRVGIHAHAFQAALGERQRVGSKCPPYTTQRSAKTTVCR